MKVFTAARCAMRFQIPGRGAYQEIHWTEPTGHQTAVFHITGTQCQINVVIDEVNVQIVDLKFQPDIRKLLAERLQQGTQIEVTVTDGRTDAQGTHGRVVGLLQFLFAACEALEHPANGLGIAFAGRCNSQLPRGALKEGKPQLRFQTANGFADRRRITATRLGGSRKTAAIARGYKDFQ